MPFLMEDAPPIYRGRIAPDTDGTPASGPRTNFLESSTAGDGTEGHPHPPNGRPGWAPLQTSSLSTQP